MVFAPLPLVLCAASVLALTETSPEYAAAAITASPVQEWWDKPGFKSFPGFGGGYTSTFEETSVYTSVFGYTSTEYITLPGSTFTISYTPQVSVSTVEVLSTFTTVSTPTPVAVGGPSLSTYTTTIVTSV